MEYSKIEDIRRSFCEFMCALRGYLYYHEGERPTIAQINKQIKNVCSCINEKDYLIDDKLLQTIGGVVVAETVTVYDKDNKEIQEINELLAEHYNVKMMSKIIDCAESVNIRMYDSETLFDFSIDKQQIKKILHL